MSTAEIMQSTENRKAVGDAVEYQGKDLEAMDFARNYHDWIFGLMRPYLGRRIVEVGAGTGGFSELFFEQDAETLTLVEPSAMFEGLKERVAAADPKPSVKLLKGIFSSIAREIEADGPDTIVYNNVLEHIEDDAGELELVRQVLQPGGRVLIFVPAGRYLFSKFDRHIGHFRRYTRRDLVDKAEAAGLRLLECRKVDSLGVFPWLLKYRLMGSLSMEPAMVRLYDRAVVPVLSRLEGLVPPPMGKNLFLVAERAA